MLEFLRKRIQVHLLLSSSLDGHPIVLPDNLQITKISSADLPVLQAINPELEPEVELEKFKNALSCYVAYWNEKPAAYGWAQGSGRVRMQSTGRYLSLKKGEFWLVSHYTAVWARGNRIHGILQKSIMKDYFDSGYHKVWLTKSADNTPSIRSGNRVGFIVERRLRCLIIRGIEIPLP